MSVHAFEVYTTASGVRFGGWTDAPAEIDAYFNLPLWCNGPEYLFARRMSHIQKH